MNDTVLPEADLSLRRMHVDIDFGGRHLQKQQHHRKNRRRQNIAVSIGERVLNEAIADQPSIYKNEDRVAVELLDLRLRNEAMQGDFARLWPFRFFFGSRRQGGGWGSPMRSKG